MSQFATSLKAALTACLFIGCIGRADERARPATNESVEIAKFVRQLADEHAKVRDNAQRELSKRPRALPALREAVASGDAEVVKRARQIIAALIVRSANDEHIDLLIERFARAKDALEVDAYWQAIYAVSSRLLNEEKKLSGLLKRERLIGAGDLEAWKRTRGNLLLDRPNEDVQVAEEGYLVRARSITFPGPVQGVFATSGRIVAQHTIMRSLMFSDEAIDVRYIIDGSVVVCAGNVSAAAIGDSVVIAGGSVQCEQSSIRSLIVCEGPFSARDRSRIPPTTLKDNRPDVLGLVKFFQIADAGLEVVADDDGIKVTKLVDGQAPQKAGLRVGDYILAVGGKRVNDVGELRRLLRRAVVDESAKISVLRGEETLQLNLSYAGWEPPAKKNNSK